MLFYYRGLEAYTSYSIKVQAFTTQVRNGNGPFSEVVYARTFENGKVTWYMVSLIFCNYECNITLIQHMLIASFQKKFDSVVFNMRLELSAHIVTYHI